MFNCWNLRKAKRHNNGLHIAHDSCHLFTGPTFKKQQNIILELIVHTKCTIGLDSSAHYDSYKQQHTIHTLCMLCAAGCVAWWVGSRARPDPAHQTNKQQHTTYTLCMLCAAGCVAWWVGSRARPDPTHQTNKQQHQQQFAF